MPISNLTSYLPTMQEFMDHWTLVNAALGTKPLVLADGTTLVAFSGLRASIQAAITAVTQAEALVSPKRQTLATQKTAIRKKLQLFRKAVLGQMANSIYPSRLPTLPKFKSTQARFIKPLEAAAIIWTNINSTPPAGFTPPLVLSDGTALADFQAAITALYTAYSAITTAEVKVGTALSQRDNLLATARTDMKQYRIVVFARLAPGDALLTRVPRYSPTAGGTPRPVTNLLLAYNGTSNTVRITFTPSVSKNIRMYQLFFAPGPKWNPTSTELIATNENVAPFAFEFPLDQVRTGETALFKVVTMNQTENSRASKVLQIKRTAAATLTLQRAA